MNKLAEICGEYLTKGKLIYIEGSIRSRQWQDQAGNKRTSYEIIAFRCRCWDRKPTRNAWPPEMRIAPHRSATLPRRRHRQPSAEPISPPEPEISDEDIPF